MLSSEKLRYLKYYNNMFIVVIIAKYLREKNI